MRYLLLLLSGILLSYGLKGQYAYRSAYRTSLMAEYLATSQSPSLNVEFIPVINNKSFISSRVGIGKPRKGYTIPVTFTYNYLLENLNKQTSARIMLKCRPNPKRINSETFVESGAGYTLRVNIGNPDYHLFYGIIGLRQQIILDIPPKARVFFIRLLYTPEIAPIGIPELGPNGITPIGTSYVNWLKSGISIGASF